MARAPREQTIETYPESDRLEGIPHPRQTERLFGHRQAERELATGLSEGRMHHAWLITGPPGIGKATLAYRFARAALTEPSTDGLNFGADPTPSLDIPADASANHLVAALSHPDLLVLRKPYDIRAKRMRTAITVDEVRKLRGFLGHRQTGGNWKVVIVDTADDLNPNAANALLKSLEEPPPRAVFLLLSSVPGRLLVTIRSRCRMLPLQPLDRDDLDAAARQALEISELEQPAPEQWSELVDAAQGSVGRMLRLATGGGLDQRAKVDTFLNAIASEDWTRVHALADEMTASAAGDKFETFIELLGEKLAELVRDTARAREHHLARNWGVARDLASWAELWETLVREKAALDTLNLDRRAFIVDCAMRLRALASQRTTG